MNVSSTKIWARTLDPHALQLLDAGLGGLGLHLLRSAQIGDQGHVDQNRIVAGTETDLDLGHYERFIDENLGKNSNVTTGKVYWSVLQKERRGDYPRAFSNLPKEAAVMPLPRPETTPPVTNTYLTAIPLSMPFCTCQKILKQKALSRVSKKSAPTP